MIGNKLEPFKFWCQKVLPNVYDDSLSYYEYLCKLNEYLNEVIAQINTLTDNMEDYESDLSAQWTAYKNALNAEWAETKNYIDNYFNNLDVQQEINNKLDQMAQSGALSTLLAPIVGTQIGDVVAQQIGGTVANQIGATVASQIDSVVAEQIDTPTANATNAWLNEHVDPVGSAVIVDSSLTISGAAADAKVTGDNFNDMHYYDITKNSVDWKELSGTIYNNVVNFNDGSTYASNRHGEYNVSSLQNQIIRVSGQSATVNALMNYGLYAFYDSSNNLISSYGASNTKYECAIAIVPSNAVKLIINCNNANVTLGLYKIDYSASGIGEKATTAYNYTETDKNDSGSHLFLYAKQTGETVGLKNFIDNTVYGSTSGRKFNVSSGDVCVITGKTAAISSSLDYNLYGFYDSSDNLIESSHYTTSYEVHTNVVVTAPVNASYCWVNGDSQQVATLSIRTSPDIASYIKSSKNVWYNKKIGIIGTSTAFGAYAEKSYSDEASKILGYNLKMFAVPGLAIHTSADGEPLQYGSFTLSKSEYESAGWTIPDAPIPYIPGGSYNNYYRTYENVFTQENADIDLWIYAVAPNNTNFASTDWDAFNKSEWRYNDNSSFAEHRKTFIGAILFIMNQMYTLNPNARMIFLLDSSYAYGDGKSNFETLKNRWYINLIDLWGKINISPLSLTPLKSQGGTNNHPSTYAHEIMGSMLSGELLSIR